MVKLTKAQRSMLWKLAKESGERQYSVQQWKLAVVYRDHQTLRCLARDGYLTVTQGAEGSTPFVKITEAGRSALSSEQK